MEARPKGKDGVVFGISGTSLRLRLFVEEYYAEHKASKREARGISKMVVAQNGESAKVESEIARNMH